MTPVGDPKRRRRGIYIARGVSPGFQRGQKHQAPEGRQIRPGSIWLSADSPGGIELLSEFEQIWVSIAIPKAIAIAMDHLRQSA